MKNIQKIKSDFENKLEGLGGVERLFESVPDSIFWVKDLDGIFVMGNQAAAKKAGKKNFNEVMGNSDFDFYPKRIAEQFRSDDLHVIKTKKEIKNRIELHILDLGGVAWHCTTKIPILNKNGDVIGVGGICRKLENSTIEFRQYKEMSKSIEFISKNFSKQFPVKKIAELACLSVSEFGRKFKKTMGVPPVAYILEVRLKAACELLVKDNETLSQIAGKTGFYNDAYLSRHFKKHIGMSPGAYRKKYSRLY